MKITSIRNRKGSKLTLPELETVAAFIQDKLDKAGFLTAVEAVNTSCIKISAGGSCFRIDTTKLGHNANIGFMNGLGRLTGKQTKTGYVRCNIPTWKQRVQFNKILNDALDKYKINADIRATGDFVIRCRKTGRVNSWNNEYNGSIVVSVREVYDHIEKPVSELAGA